MKFLFGAVVALAIAVIAVPAMALSVPKAPPLERPIVDQTNTLSSDQIDELSQQINKGREKQNYQLGVLIVDSLEGRPIEQYSLQVAREWGVGDKQTSNGALMLISIGDREMRIEVGRGLEGGLTDARSRRIIDNAMKPYFVDENYYQGISVGISEIERAIKGLPETQITESAPDQSIAEVISGAFPFIVMALVWVGSILGRSKSWWAGGVIGGVIGFVIALIAGFALASVVALIALILGGLILDYAVSKNYRKHREAGDQPSWWAGGGGFGGGGGGGFGGFGGGGFGGGGASGRW